MTKNFYKIIGSTMLIAMMLIPIACNESDSVSTTIVNSDDLLLILIHNGKIVQSLHLLVV